MCGIAGILNLRKDQKIFSKDVENMLDQISHRGPDDQSVAPFGDLILGHTRLSILDSSENGRQPMTRSNLVITFNGLIFNYLELKKELEAENYKFQSGTDTEVLLYAYDFWGSDFVSKLNGMWAFALYDKSKNTILFSRDRYGIKPLYFYESHEKLYFASEIKAFTVSKHWKAKLNHNRAYDFLKFGLKNHTPETMFAGVEALDPGTNLIFHLDDHSREVQQYYHLEYAVTHPTPTFEEAKNHFFSLFEDSIKIRMRSDVEVGMSLSGGLDSSAIALGMKNSHPNIHLKAICSSASDSNFNELPYAEMVSNQCDFQLYHQLFQREHLNQLAQVIYQQDEPFPGASVIAQNCVFAKAHDLKLKVMLSGQGADEYLMGYNAFLSLYFLNRNPILHPIEFLNFIWKHRKTVWNYNIMRKKAAEPMVDLNIENSKIYQPESICDLKEQSHQYFNQTVLPSLLHFEDRNSMAYGIESRLPFLDYRLVDYCFRLPEEFFIKKGFRKRLLRESFRRLYPQKIFRRYDKSAFSNPYVSWIKNDINRYTSEIKKAGIQIPHNMDIPSIWRTMGFITWKQVYNVND